MSEIWLSPDGRPCFLELAPPPPPSGEDWEDGWYPEAPGQLPPKTYLVDGEQITVSPVGGWSWYDAISDILIRRGYTPPPPTPEELATCEHGLSAQLCAGPMHYPDDRSDW